MKCQRFKSRQQRALELADYQRDHFLHTTRGRSLRRSLERWTFSHFTDPYRERWSSDVQDHSLTPHNQAGTTLKQSIESRSLDHKREMEKRFELTTNAWESSSIFDLLSITDEDVDEELRLRIERLLLTPTENTFGTRVADQDELESQQASGSSEIEESSTLGLVEERTTSSLEVEKGYKNPYLNFLRKKSHSEAVEEAAVEADFRENIDTREDTSSNSEDNEANVEENDEVEGNSQDHIEEEVKTTGETVSGLKSESSESEGNFHPGSSALNTRALQFVNNEKQNEAPDLNEEKEPTDLEGSIKSTVNIIMKAAAIQKNIAQKKRRKRGRKKNIKDVKSEDTLENQKAVLEALEESTVLKLFQDYLRFERPQTLAPLKSDIIFTSSILPE